MPIAPRGPRKAMRGKCERGRGGCESLRGRWVLAGASFGPMAAISRRGQGGRIYNNTRARVLLRRMCVKPANRTTHSPPKAFARPRTATRPSRALPLPHAAPTPARRLRDAFPTDRTTHSPPTSPPIPAEDLRPPPHSNTPFPSTSDRPRNPDARPQAARCIPHRPHNPFPRRSPSLVPAQRHALPEHFRSPTQPRHTPTQPRRTPAGCATHSPQPSQLTPRSATLPPLPFRFGHKKTAPHSACAMPNVSVDRRCGRSFGLVSRALFAAVAGRWRVGVGLRPQPWALRSRRCGRVLRA